ncbi:MAG: alanine racemase [Treponema sp.]|jgi:D-serine deaminase-like pyridoxal phosphate-dependent protein|nr:alanine racemase [Treponema sp.]
MELSNLETPCIIINVEQAWQNIVAMQQAVSEAGCRLRPHIKTHKMPFFARMQMEAGAAGITCAKVSEAERMADGGLDDIFIAYPLVGAFRIRRAIALVKQVKRLILAIDSFEGAAALSHAAIIENMCFEVRLEVDTGAKRTGALMRNAVLLAENIARLPGLRLTGIYTFKSLNYQGEATCDNELAAREEAELLAETARAIRNKGIALKDISGGSSPTGLAVAKTGAVNEVRPGTYIFKDLMLCNEGVAKPEEIAARFVATVVSCPCEEYAIIDGGTKCFPTDVPLNTAPFFYTAYAYVEGMEHLRLNRMNEEHGIISSITGKTGLRVGQTLSLLPLHICTAINMQNNVYLWEQGITHREPVSARGMLI